jgi:hypothetical protein
MSVLNPSTFLELTQRLFQECQLPGSGPSTSIAATGQTFDLFAWVSQSCKEIDELHEDWSYLLVHPGVSFATVAGQQLYTPTQAGVTVGDVGIWKIDTFRNYLTATGFSSEIEMSWINYDDWLRTEKIGVLRTTQVRPMVFTIAPDKSIGLQCPLAGYTVIGDYYRIPVVLESDSDTPLIPQRYRMAIVYRAMMFYGASENAPEVYNEAEKNFKLALAAMRRTQLPTARFGGALA